MPDQKKQTTTSDTVKKSPPFKKWLTLWWPIIFLGIVFLLLASSKYIWPETLKDVYPVMVDVVKATSLFLVAIYVIYTRILAIETQKMAEASMGLYISERGTLLLELSESVYDYNGLLDEVKEITKIMHIQDKGIDEEEFNSLSINKKINCIAIKITNTSRNFIKINRVEYLVRHTGCERYYDIVCDTSKDGRMEPWDEKAIPLIASTEGEIEVKDVSVKYTDAANVVRTTETVEVKSLKRIRKPENR